MSGVKGSGKFLFLFSAGAMEFIWLYLLSAPFFLLTGASPFPMREAMLTFVLAFLLASALKGRGCRVIVHLALHLGFFLAAAWWTLFLLYGTGSGPLFGREWLAELLGRPYGLREGYLLCQVLFWVIAFWAGALALARRSLAYRKVTARFDLGVILIFLALIMAGAGGVSIPHGGPLIIAYFIFSMVAIAQAKSMEASPTAYLGPFRHVGPALAFAALVLLLGTGTVLLFLPALTAAAELGYGTMLELSGPLVSILAAVLKFFFGGARGLTLDEGGAGGMSGAEEPALESSPLNPLLERILGWGAAVLFILLLLALAGWGIYRLMRWLFSRTGAAEARGGFWAEIRLCLDRLAGFVRKLLSKAGRLWQEITGSGQSAASFFFKLCKWGRSCGLPRRAGETPREYGASLSSCFPFGEAEIMLIVELFCREIYGRKTLAREQLLRLQNAWRRLRSPLQWPRRLRYRLFPPQAQQKNKDCEVIA